MHNIICYFHTYYFIISSGSALCAFFSLHCASKGIYSKWRHRRQNVKTYFRATVFETDIGWLTEALFLILRIKSSFKKLLYVFGFMGVYDICTWCIW